MAIDKLNLATVHLKKKQAWGAESENKNKAIDSPSLASLHDLKRLEVLRRYEE